MGPVVCREAEAVRDTVRVKKLPLGTVASSQGGASASRPSVLSPGGFRKALFRQV